MAPLFTIHLSKCSSTTTTRSGGGGNDPFSFPPAFRRLRFICLFWFLLLFLLSIHLLDDLCLLVLDLLVNLGTAGGLIPVHPRGQSGIYLACLRLC